MSNFYAKAMIFYSTMAETFDNGTGDFITTTNQFFSATSDTVKNRKT